jgi:essential nuclear protein 1
MFVSNLNQKMSQRFLVLVLLPHVRSDIRANRRLHFALFQVGGEARRRLRRVCRGLAGPEEHSALCSSE